MRGKMMVGLVLGVMVAGCSGLQAGAREGGWWSEPGGEGPSEPSNEPAGWATEEAEPAPSAEGAPRSERPGDRRCSFGDCSSDGWTTTDSDGSTSTTRCSFGDCNTNGWTTTTSSGETTHCRCKFGDCNANGVDCD